MSYFSNVTIKHVLQLNKRLFTPLRIIHTTEAQYLYSPSALGIDGYLQSRKRIREQFATYSDNFKAKMTEFVSDQKNMIFTEDLKNTIHMAEPADLELVTKMIKKFNTQNTEYRFGSFVFGPVVMRMFHFLDAPEEALKCFEDSANKAFFDQLVSYQILLDLLYNNEMYEEMYSVFKTVQDRQLNMSKFPKYPVVLILAACFKQNTPQSMQYASKLWSDMTSAGTAPLRRAGTFMAALALKQGAPHVALEVISSMKPHYVTVRNIRAVALAETGRFDDALAVLKSVLDIDIPEQKDKHTFFEETVTKVGEAIAKSENKDIQRQYENIVKALKDRNLIDTQTLDQLLNNEIQANRPFQDNRAGQQYTQKKMPFSQRTRLNLN